MSEDFKARVLFVCNQNSARSQMAEHILRNKYKDRFLVESAGVSPAKKVHPLAIEVLSEVGINASNANPKSFDEIEEDEFDIIVSVCEADAELCPPSVFGRLPVNLPILDPARVADGINDYEGKLDAFRTARRELVWVVQHVVDLAERAKKQENKQELKEQSKSEYDHALGREIRARAKEALTILCPPPEDLICIQRSKLEIILRDGVKALCKTNIWTGLGLCGSLGLNSLTVDLPDFAGFSGNQLEVLLIGAFILSIGYVAYTFFEFFTKKNNRQFVEEVLEKSSGEAMLSAEEKVPLLKRKLIPDG